MRKDCMRPEREEILLSVRLFHGDVFSAVGIHQRLAQRYSLPCLPAQICPSSHFYPCLIWSFETKSYKLLFQHLSLFPLPNVHSWQSVGLPGTTLIQFAWQKHLCHPLTWGFGQPGPTQRGLGSGGVRAREIPTINQEHQDIQLYYMYIIYVYCILYTVYTHTCLFIFMVYVIYYNIYIYFCVCMYACSMYRSV